MSKVLNDLAKKHPDMIFEDTVAECLAAFRSIKPVGKQTTKTVSTVTYQRVWDDNERQREGYNGRIYQRKVGWVYEVRVDGEYVDNFEKLRHVKQAFPNAVRRPVE